MQYHIYMRIYWLKRTRPCASPGPNDGCSEASRLPASDLEPCARLSDCPLSTKQHPSEYPRYDLQHTYILTRTYIQNTIWNCARHYIKAQALIIPNVHAESRHYRIEKTYSITPHLFWSSRFCRSYRCTARLTLWARTPRPCRPQRSPHTAQPARMRHRQIILDLYGESNLFDVRVLLLVDVMSDICVSYDLRLGQTHYWGSATHFDAALHVQLIHIVFVHTDCVWSKTIANIPFACGYTKIRLRREAWTQSSSHM